MEHRIINGIRPFNDIEHLNYELEFGKSVNNLSRSKNKQ